MIEANSVVSNFKQQRRGLQLQINRHLRAVGVACGIVDRLFENSRRDELTLPGYFPRQSDVH